LVGHVIVGGGIGRTVIVNVHWFVPHWLVARQVTVVTPSGKQNPGGGLQPINVPPFIGGSG
jgi:hypothetical protein